MSITVALFLLSLAATGATATPSIQTRIARWSDDKQAAFLLMFDDSMPSHVRNVVPELKKRGFVGTFYVNPGKGEWGVFREKWEKEFPTTAGIVYGNHTWTHKGARSIEQADEEIRQCNEMILRLFPGSQPRLISYGQPGVKKEDWTISKDQLAELLQKYHLIERPPFKGAVIHYKTAEDMRRVVDKALASGGLEYVVFHGVGGEWISAPLDVFHALLDALEAHRDRIWITDHISAHKYQTERDSAEVKTLAIADRQIRLVLTCRADPKLYDLPLTLVVSVPWKRCRVTQGAARATVAVADGLARFQALPNGVPITLDALAE